MTQSKLDYDRLYLRTTLTPHLLISLNLPRVFKDRLELLLDALWNIYKQHLVLKQRMVPDNCRDGHFRYFLIFSLIKNDFLHFLSS